MPESNALIGLHMMRMAIQIETLVIERDNLTAENEALKAEINRFQAANTGPRSVPSPEPDIGEPA